MEIFAQIIVLLAVFGVYAFYFLAFVFAVLMLCTLIWGDDDNSGQDQE